MGEFDLPAPPQGVERKSTADSADGLDPERSKHIGCSDLGALMGCSDAFNTPAGLHARVTGVELGGPDPESVVIQRGHDFEEAVAKRYARKHPNCQVIKARESYLMRSHGLIGHPDYYVLDPERGFGVLECKVVIPSSFKKRWTDDDDSALPPLTYAYQVVGQMMLTGARWGTLSALVSDAYTHEAHDYDVPLHAGIVRMILERLKQFWADVQAGRIPTFDLVRDGPVIAALYPHAVPGKVLDLRHDNRFNELLAEKERLRLDASALELQRKQVDNEIKAKMGDADTAEGNERIATLREVVRHIEARDERFRQLRLKKVKAA